jgi:hypothetical protein
MDTARASAPVRLVPVSPAPPVSPSRAFQLPDSRPSVPGPHGPQPPAARTRVARRLLNGAPLAAALAIVGAAMAWNLQGFPGRVNDDEGTYVDRAWAMLSAHHLSNYTYYWDHPFLGWTTIGAWRA